MGRKLRYTTGIVVLAIVAGVIYLYWPKTAERRQSNAIPITGVSAPSGWKIEQQSADFTMFVKRDGDAISNRIDVAGAKTGKTMEQWLASLYPEGNFPYATLTATSSPSGAETVAWALVNGHLVLADTDLESGSPFSRALNYSVYDHGNAYVFALMPYQLYNTSTKTIEINQYGVETLKAVVQNFTESLPAE